MTEATQAAEALRSFERLLRAAASRPYDPAFDVEVAEDVRGIFAADEALNDIAALRRTAEFQGRPTRWHKAKVNPGREERVDRASERFAEAAYRLIRQWRRGTISADQLRRAVRIAYIRQARVAFRAGKRALGNLSPLTLEDEREIARAAEDEGLISGLPIRPRSLGALVERIVSQPPPPPEQARVAEDIDELLVQHLLAQTRQVMTVTGGGRPDLEAIIAKQQAKAEERLSKGLSGLRRRVLSGTLTTVAAVGIIALLLHTEGERAARRAVGQPLTPEQQANVSQAIAAIEEETVAPLRDGGINWGQLLLFALMTEIVLGDNRVNKWLRDRLGRIKGRFYALGQAGEQSAFRDGIPIPDPEADELPGAGQALPEPGWLERAIRVWWNLDPEAEHCIDCIRLTDMSPYFLDRLSGEGIYPGSHHTRCWDRCRCYLLYELPTYEEIADIVGLPTY